jgi:hypothetical protein
MLQETNCGHKKFKRGHPSWLIGPLSSDPAAIVRVHFHTNLRPKNLSDPLIHNMPAPVVARATKNSAIWSPVFGGTPQEASPVDRLGLSLQPPKDEFQVGHLETESSHPAGAKQ